MEFEEPIYKGFLLLPPAGKLVLKKTWQQKYCLLFKASKFGIERLEVYDTPENGKNATPTRIITLENCIKITSKSLTHFSVTTKNTPGIYEFNTSNPESKNDWLNALQSVAFPEDTSHITSIEEDNDLYCSSAEGVFNVRIHPSPASQRCALNDKPYMLILTSTAIQLRSLPDNKLLYTWPYCFIRRYGYKSGRFIFEAGRKCESGEGTFILEHTNQQEIFRCLSSKMKSMKQLLKGDSTTVLLDCGDNQFHAALSMEARSRSPLPPSPTTSTSLHDIDTGNLTQSSLKEIDKFKTKPKKPPRKNLPLTDNNGKNSDTYESMNKYDSIEYRIDAWRTHGINNIDHTENIDNNNEIQPQFNQKKFPTDIDVVPLKVAPMILTEPSIHDDGSYDRLDFFGNSSKSTIKPGYKQVNVLPSTTTTKSIDNKTNDYDEVQPIFESIRLADDSHLGYALVRKEIQKDNSIDHQFHNDEPYAIVSKPKRV